MLNKLKFLTWVFIFQFVVNHKLIANEDYVVRDVQVDVTGSSALEARAKAMADAQRQAYNKLLDRILPRQETVSLTLSDEQLDTFVQSIEVQNEKTSNVRYLGMLTIHFNPQAVQKWIISQDKTISSSVNDSKASIIIPVLIRHEKILLWEENNPWWQAWNQKKDLDGEAFLVPMGDLQDLKSLSAKDALEGNINSIRKILSRYNTNRMIIPIFYEGVPSRLEIYHYATEGLIDRSSSVEFDTNIYAPTDLLSLAMSKVMGISKTNSLTSVTSQPKILYFTVFFNTYPEWIELQTNLVNLQGVNKMTIHNLSLKTAQISLDCSASETFIENQLNTKGILIDQPMQGLTSKTLSLGRQESKNL